jgi:spore coat protein U-like protein
MKKLTKLLAATAVGMAALGSAQAQTATTTFQVTANVLDACTVAATNLAFGDYSASLGAPVDSTSTITVTCSNGLAYDVSVGASANARTMARTLGGGSLNYGMFNEAGRTTAFVVPTATGSGIGQSYTVFGRIPGGQFVPTGNYADTVNVTVTY